MADLYDPDLMPANLRKAHQTLDSKVDRLYTPKGFTSDFERVAHLFGLYEKMTAPLAAAAAKPKTRRRKKPQPSSLDDLRRDRARDEMA